MNIQKIIIMLKAGMKDERLADEKVMEGYVMALEKIENINKLK